MITAKGTFDDKDTVFIGLSHKNLDILREHGFDQPILVRADGAMKLPFNIVIFAGETEAAMVSMMAPGLGPDTTVKIDPKLKS